MTAERWQLIKAIFDEAEPWAAEQRAVVINQRCGEDCELRRMIEQLFEGIDDSFIRKAIVEELISLGKER